jgi:hypothetical protein
MEAASCAGCRPKVRSRLACGLLLAGSEETRSAQQLRIDRHHYGRKAHQNRAHGWRKRDPGPRKNAGSQRYRECVVPSGPGEVLNHLAIRRLGQADHALHSLGSSDTRTTPADSIATSVPAPIAIPTCARARAGASLTPSPTIATSRPRVCRSATARSGPGIHEVQSRSDTVEQSGDDAYTPRSRARRSVTDPAPGSP